MLEGLGIFIGVVVAYLGSVILLPIMDVKEQPMQIATEAVEVPSYRQNVEFLVEGEVISGWLYLPDSVTAAVPCVVMNNGFCGTKDMILPPYAKRFTEAGSAVLSFDYRHFGESEGHPRQLYAIELQLADSRAAIAYARSRPEIDPEKIVVWGTSSAGISGILLAGTDQEIAGVIGQTPSFDHQIDGKKILKRDGMGWFLKLIVHGQRDKGRSRIGLSEHTFPAAGKPGTTAMLIGPGVYEGYEQMALNSTTFKNTVCARLMFDSHGPGILESAERVQCPVQIHLCEFDNINTPSIPQRIEEVLGDNLEIIRHAGGHFDIYYDAHFERAIAAQIGFLGSIFSPAAISDGKKIESTNIYDY